VVYAPSAQCHALPPPHCSLRALWLVGWLTKRCQHTRRRRRRLRSRGRGRPYPCWQRCPAPGPWPGRALALLHRRWARGQVWVRVRAQLLWQQAWVRVRAWVWVRAQLLWQQAPWCWWVRVRAPQWWWRPWQQGQAPPWTQPGVPRRSPPAVLRLRLSERPVAHDAKCDAQEAANDSDAGTRNDSEQFGVRERG
jgi:hypothetical protein